MIFKKAAYLFIFETRSPCVVQAGIELVVILLPQPLMSWDYRWAPPNLATMYFKIENVLITFLINEPEYLTIKVKEEKVTGSVCRGFS